MSTSSSGLSGGAKAGIAIGVVVGVVAVASALACGLSKRSNRKVGGWQKEPLDQEYAYPNGRSNNIELQQGRSYFQ